ncbi:MAG: HNH endonuclease, partial [Ornithinibacter sp.]
MDQPLMSLAETRSAMLAARDALAGFGQVVHQASGAELAELMTLADEVSAGAGAARVQVTVEAIDRGEVESAGVN